MILKSLLNPNLNPDLFRVGEIDLGFGNLRVEITLIQNSKRSGVEGHS